MGLVPPQVVYNKVYVKMTVMINPWLLKIELLCVRDVYIQSVKLAIGIYDCSKQEKGMQHKEKYDDLGAGHAQCKTSYSMMED